MLTSTKLRTFLVTAAGILSSIISYGDEYTDELRTQAGVVDSFHGKPRVFVLTDIGNEPDDQMSLTRFLCTQ
jgi:Cellulose-binding Sde182, nucleoside hydrolase-like domain